MGYPPPGPPPQQPFRPRGGKNQTLLGCGLSIVAAVLLMGSCGVGMAIGADPEATSATPAHTKTVTAQATVTVTAAAPAPTPSAPASPAPAAAPARVALPNVVGRNGAIAQETLVKKGITNIQFASADPTAEVVVLVSNWRVTKQEPKAGAKVRPGDLVVLTAVKVN